MVNNDDNNISTKQGADGSLHKLVAALPEIYQPVFNHPELSTRIMRDCGDRLSHIEQIYKTLETKLNRPLRVLDLGCAQGFFSLSLAKLGATVHGVDFLDANIAVCNALASEHPEFDASFQAGLVEEVILQLEQMPYDLVLGLSVFHHIVHRLGVDIVQKMLAVVAAGTVAGIFEMALASEPLYWAASQPQNPKQLLSGYAFVHEFARNKSHLSATNRPLYIASNYYWFLNNQAEAFDTWKAESHEFTKNTSNGTRRYFFGNRHLVKLFTLDDVEFHDINLREHMSEAAFLTSPPKDFRAPQLFLYGRHESEAWIARELFLGELLLDTIRLKKPYDVELVIRDTLEQLAILESAGFYHNDLRTWNVLIGPDGRATLIDYGSVSKDNKDQSWPYNLFLSFMIYMHDVINGSVTISNPVSYVAFNPENFPAL